jgi:hypothetical protein
MVVGLQVALVLALAGAAWGGAVGAILVIAGPMRSHAGFISNLLGGIVGCGVLGAGLAVVMHTFLGRILRWIAETIPFAGVAVGLLVTLPYYMFAWPGVKIAEWRGWIRFADSPAPRQDHPAPEDATDHGGAPGACPYAGQVVAEKMTKVLGFDWPQMEPVFIITEDWRVRTSRNYEFGYISRDGSIYEGFSGFGGHSPEKAAQGPGKLVSPVAHVRGGRGYTANDEEIGPLWS